MLNLGSCSEFTESMERDAATFCICPIYCQNKIQYSDKWKSQLFMEMSVFATCLQADAPH